VSAAHNFQFFVDQPASWKSTSTGLLVRGWCFCAGPSALSGIRLLAGPGTFFGTIGLARPDVRAALPDAPDDRTGFEIRAILPPGPVTLTIEAGTADGRWHEIVRQDIVVTRPRLPRWLGGGTVSELIAFQMPAHMAYPPRPVRAETFPEPPDRGARPKFSIVTPSFQQARFLGETMRSVLTQAGVECDYFVQDGGSTDGSTDVIRRFAADSQSPIALPARAPRRRGRPAAAPPSWPQLVDWTSAPDDGQAGAIARGFAQTTGAPDDLMAWLNSDDFYLPGALNFVADYFSRHPEVDAIYGHRIVVNEESQEIARWFLPRHDAAVLRLNDFVPQETLFWRRRIWDQVGGLDPALKFAMDWDLLLRFQAAGARIVRVPRFLACFRVHPAQKTSAALHDVGQREIDMLRTRAQGREIPAATLERHPRLIRYLKRSAFLEMLWKFGLPAR
jgi:GT2 family glycosyltransferase